MKTNENFRNWIQNKQYLFKAKETKLKNRA